MTQSPRKIEANWEIPDNDCFQIQYQVEFRQVGEDDIIVTTEHTNVTFDVLSPPCSIAELIVIPVFNDELQQSPKMGRQYISK